MATKSKHSDKHQRRSIRVTLPAPIIEAFDQWRNGGIRPVWFDVVILRMAELDGDGWDRAYKRWIDWDNAHPDAPKRNASFTPTARIMDMLNQRIDTCPGGRHTRGNVIAAAILDVKHAPLGQWASSACHDLPPNLVALERYHQFRDVDDDFAEAIRRIYTQAGSQAPEFCLRGRAPVEPGEGGLDRYNMHGGCLSDDELPVRYEEDDR